LPKKAEGIIIKNSGSFSLNIPVKDFHQSKALVKISDVQMTPKISLYEGNCRKAKSFYAYFYMAAQYLFLVGQKPNNLFLTILSLHFCQI
jgi:hypothetical protein